jgi:signal recognition particle subunit SRP54
MFEILTEKLNSVFQKLSSKGRLTESDVDRGLREVRLALLEADVNFRVVKDFIAAIRERAVDSQVLESLTPAQQVVKIVHEELRVVLGEGQAPLNLAGSNPDTILLVGLQGSGKTTTAAKLARHLRKTGRTPMLVAADPYRPAAIDQLVTLGNQLDIPVHSDDPEVDPLQVCQDALSRARAEGASPLIIDTAGRLHIDEDMMAELVELKEVLSPSEVLLVLDAMTGQDAVNAAEEFHQRLGVSGLVLTKLDGDARGGAALSIRSVTGVPIKFTGVGEKLDALEPFHPDRLATRIMGMGDMLTLIERAEETFDKEKVTKLEKKLRRAEYDLEDFLDQLQQMRKMGPLRQIMEMIPGFPSVSRQMPEGGLEEKQVKKVEAIVQSMTPQERRRPQMIDGSRRRRIAKGSGTTAQDVNKLLNQFRQMQKIVKQLALGKRPGDLASLLRSDGS